MVKKCLSATGYYLVAEIVNILCDEKYLAEDGKPDVEKMQLITFDPVHHAYIQLGKTVGNAFSDGKKLDFSGFYYNMKEINYKEMEFNPFNLIGGEWMLVTAGNEQSGCNTMTASWGHLGCLWGHNDPTAVIYLRPSRYTKKFVDEEPYFTLCVMDKSFKKQMAYLGSVSGRDEDKIAKTGLTPVYADNSVYFAEAKLVLICKKMYAAELQESGFIYQDTINESYPQHDFHTMYMGKIEKVLVRDDEYLKN